MEKTKKQMSIKERLEAFSTGTHRGVNAIRTDLPDGGFTLAFVRTPLPSEKKGEISRFSLVKDFRSYMEEGAVIKYRGENDVFFGLYIKRFSRAGSKVYAKKTWGECISWKDGKVKVSNTEDSEMPYLILRNLGLECVLRNPLEKTKTAQGDNANFWEEYPDLRGSASLLRRMMRCKAVLEGVFNGKITNRRDAVRAYIKAAYKVKDFNYLEMERFFTLVRYSNGIELAPTITELKETTPSLDEAVKVLNRLMSDLASERSREKFSLIKDLVMDGLLLGKQINPRWSLLRMQEEHSANIEQEMLLEEKALSTDSIWNGVFDITERNIHGHIINSEREAYREASEQHNCVYTHYFPWMRSGGYIGLSLDTPERCTVGIRVSKFSDGTAQLSFDQIRARHNEMVEKRTEELVKRWVEDNAERFLGLESVHSQDKSVVDDEYLVF